MALLLYCPDPTKQSELPLYSAQQVHFDTRADRTLVLLINSVYCRQRGVRANVW